MQQAKESEASQVEIFLNSVPLLKSLTREEKLMLVDAVEEQVFPAGTTVITQASLPTCAIALNKGFTDESCMPSTCVQGRVCLLGWLRGLGC